MKQIILLNTYVGLSDFTFEVTSTGRELNQEEVLAKGLFTKDMQRRHKESSYVYQWYEVSPGDTFTIVHISDDVSRQTVLRVPASSMRNPNTSVDDLNTTGIWLEDHLLTQCEIISQENM
jgi:hypothetical protein